MSRYLYIFLYLLIIEKLLAFSRSRFRSIQKVYATEENVEIGKCDLLVGFNNLIINNFKTRKPFLDLRFLLPDFVREGAIFLFYSFPFAHSYFHS